MNLCQFKDIFGTPRNNIHSYRIFDIAIVDTVLTVILANLLSIYFSYNFWTLLIFLLFFSVFIHWLFCVDTALLTYLRL